MIGAVIYYGKNTLVAELPMGTMDLQMKLSSIGVGEPADRIPLKNDEERQLQVKLYLSLSAELREYFDYSAYGSDLQDEYGTGQFVRFRARKISNLHKNSKRLKMVHFYD